MDGQGFVKEEPYLMQEIILGIIIAIGILLMVVSDIIGMLIVLLGLISLLGLYFYRIYSTFKIRGEVVFCCFSWLNSATMIIAVVGILGLMLTNIHHRYIFITGLALLIITLLLNIFFQQKKVNGTIQLTAQVRVLVAVVLLVVFYLL